MTLHGFCKRYDVLRCSILCFSLVLLRGEVVFFFAAASTQALLILRGQVEFWVEVVGWIENLVWQGYYRMTIMLYWW